MTILPKTKYAYGPKQMSFSHYKDSIQLKINQTDKQRLKNKNQPKHSMWFSDTSWSMNKLLMNAIKKISNRTRPGPQFQLISPLLFYK